MTVETLLAPRYKCIADYPGSDYDVDDIIYFEEWRGAVTMWRSHDQEGKFLEFEEFYKEFPHLFKKLEWWEGRKPEDFPDFLKDIGDGEIFKVIKYLDNTQALIELNNNSKQNHTGFHQASLQHFLPATQTDYDNYKTLNP